MKLEWRAPGRDKPDVEGVVFRAEIAQIKTMADGGYRIVLDLGEADANAVGVLLPAVRKVVFAAVLTPCKE